MADLGRGVFSFFIGSAAFHAFGYVLRSPLSTQLTRRLLYVFTTLLWLLNLASSHVNSLYQIYRSHLWNETLLVNGKDVIGAALLSIRPISYELILFPLTIVSLALWETHREAARMRFAFLGQISYSSYLLHFPIQLTILVIASLCGVSNTVFYSPWALLPCFSALLPLSIWSYRILGRP